MKFIEVENRKMVAKGWGGVVGSYHLITVIYNK